MANAKLKPNVKVFIVQQLAMWEGPKAIQTQLKERFDIDISLPAILNYDPTTKNGGDKWTKLFNETRAKFVEDVATIPIANKAFRLRELDRIYHIQKKKPDAQQNTIEARAALEQAAKEAGNLFTNRTEHTGKGGAPLISEMAPVVVYLPDNNRGDSSNGPDPVPGS